MLRPLARVPIEHRGLRSADPTSAPISCFCCRDSALVIPWVVRRYAIPDYSLFDLPLACQRTACQARNEWVDTPEGSAQKRVDKFNFEWLDLRLKPEDCEAIHRAERDRIQGIASEEAQRRSMPDLSGVIRTMPDAPKPPSESEIEAAKRRALAKVPPNQDGEVELWA